MKKKASNLLRTINTFITKHHKIMDDLPERYTYNPTLRWNADLESYFSNAYGPHHFSRIFDALTRPSCYFCIRVNTLKSTPDAAIEKLRTVLKEKGADISKCEVEGMDYVLSVKGSGPHAIDYGCAADGNPPKEVLVSRKCAEAVLRGAQCMFLVYWVALLMSRKGILWRFQLRLSSPMLMVYGSLGSPEGLCCKVQRQVSSVFVHVCGIEDWITKIATLLKRP